MDFVKRVSVSRTQNAGVVRAAPLSTASNEEKKTNRKSRRAHRRGGNRRQESDYIGRVSFYSYRRAAGRFWRDGDSERIRTNNEAPLLRG
ncbi:hypothetical protein EYF80_030947 [Liparis tanakae]|uniref:Uncharacterized protein n=1 Tax=Liparis tanakae TaxID=230148 RepID=A0A4Z2GYW2_9TELE|nr:hypothetical protein EYF80_030947 [Liparis tanakae]